MANYLALIAISKNNLISFLSQQLIKSHSRKTVRWTRLRDFCAQHEVTSFMTSLHFLLFALRATLNVLRFRNEQALQSLVHL